MSGELLTILALVLANGLLSGAEIAILTFRSGRVQQLLDEGSRWAEDVRLLRLNPERFLSTVQVGITVVGATAAAYGGSSLTLRVTEALIGVPWVGDHAHTLAFFLVVGGISYLSLVIGELVPKSLALRSPEAYAWLVAGLLRRLSWWMHPIVWFLTQSSNILLKPFGDEATFTESRLSREDLARLVDEAAECGAVDAHTRDVAQRALRFPTLTAADLAVPRPRIIALPRDADRQRVLETFAQGRHTRLPVYDGSLDRILGHVTAIDVAVAGLRGDFDLAALIRPVPIIPLRTPAATVLRILQSHPGEMALLVDEQGIISGLITVEDLVEELVGEVLGGHEAEEQRIRIDAPGVAFVWGDTPTREVNRALGLSLPEAPEWTTIAGLCIHLAGWIPAPGTKLSTSGGVDLEIVEATPRVVRHVRVHYPA